MRRLVLICVLALAAAAPAVAGAVPLRFDRTVARSGSGLIMDLGPAELSQRTELPSGLVVSLPRGIELDMQSRKRRCPAADVRAVTCHRSSNIGFGHLVVRFTSYLFPGGETHAVATVRAFLGHPLAAGDPGSIVLEARLQGVKAIRQAVFSEFGVFLPQLKFAWVGRIRPVPGSGAFGHELRFENFPGGARLPLPLVARLTRLKLAIGAVRRLKRTFYRTFRAPAFENGRIVQRTRRVRDHVLVPHHLMRNPRRCRTRWPWQIEVRFPDGTQTTRGNQRCKNGKIPISPPRSPSAPQHS